MLAVDERVQALTGMDQLINAFYAHAVRLNVHPFLELAGVMERAS